MIWAKLLGYEPAIGQLVKDAGNPALARVRMVIDDEDHDHCAILYALRRTFEIGQPLPPEMGLAICDLLESKNPANKPPATKSQKVRDKAWAEGYAEELGCLRVGLIMENHPRFAEQAAIEICRYPGVRMKVGTTTFNDFQRHNRLAILCGEVREIERRLNAGSITIEGDYQKWVSVLKRYQFTDVTSGCRARLEFMFKKNSELNTSTK